MLKIKLLCAVALMLGCLSVASAETYNYDTRCCCTQDPYSKFACNSPCQHSEYPQQRFIDHSP